MGEQIAHEVHSAALPGGAEHFGDGRLDALVRVGDDELETAQAAACEAAQVVGPEGLGLGWADRHAEHFATTVAVGADGDDHRHRDDPPGLAHLSVSGVDPEATDLSRCRSSPSP